MTEEEGRSSTSADSMERALIDLEKGRAVLLYRRGVAEPLKGDFQGLDWNDLVRLRQMDSGHEGQTLLMLEDIVGVTGLETASEYLFVVWPDFGSPWLATKQHRDEFYRDQKGE